MGAFVSKMWKWIFSLPEFKIITVGLDNAGKTTIVYRLVLNDVVATIPTVGSNVEELVYKNLKFLVWDLGGQTVFRDTWSTYYTNTHAVIFVVDSTDRERISCAKDEFLKMLESDLLKDSLILVFANKQDVKGALSPAEISEEFGLTRIKDHEWHIQPCCGLTGQGLSEGLDWIASKVQIPASK